jgi:hypothetical protein
MNFNKRTEFESELWAVCVANSQVRHASGDAVAVATLRLQSLLNRSSETICEMFRLVPHNTITAFINGAKTGLVQLRRIVLFRNVWIAVATAEMHA